MVNIHVTSTQNGHQNLRSFRAHRKNYLETGQVDHVLNRVRRGQTFLAHGSTGLAVKILQQDINVWLKQIGSKKRVGVSGKFDRDTKHFVYQFQRSFRISKNGKLAASVPGKCRKGLYANGVVGIRTQYALDRFRKRKSLSFNKFKKLTRGVWDTGHVLNGWRAADGRIPTALRKAAPIRSLKVPKVSKLFLRMVEQYASLLRTNPKWILQCMSFETGGTFSPKVKNKAGSKATGLIQFMPSTARQLNTSTRKLSKMSQIKQLQYVYKYLKPFRGRLHSLADCYMAIFCPRGVGKNDRYVLYSKGKPYRQNRGLDRNRDRRITKNEAAQKVLNHARSKTYA